MGEQESNGNTRGPSTGAEWWPEVAFGTYKVGLTKNPDGPLDEGEVSAAIHAAVATGYRAFDCAKFYANERAVGTALKSAASQHGLKRADFYIISKVWTDTIFAGPEACVAQLNESVANLDQISGEGDSTPSYVDLYLIHWPVPGKHVAAYKALEPLCGGAKLTRRLGLSNYTKYDYEELLAAKPAIVPYSNQFEINPTLYRKKTIDYFQNQGLKIQAYRSYVVRINMPFADGKLLRASDGDGKTGSSDHHLEQVLRSVQQNHPTKTISQILLRWGMQRNIQVLPKSVSAERIRENFGVWDFVLSVEDLTKMDAMDDGSTLAITYKANYEKCSVRDTPLAGSRADKGRFYEDEE